MRAAATASENQEEVTDDCLRPTLVVEERLGPCLSEPTAAASTHKLPLSSRCILFHTLCNWLSGGLLAVFVLLLLLLSPLFLVALLEPLFCISDTLCAVSQAKSLSHFLRSC